MDLVGQKEYQRRYREANKEKLAEYREANKEKLAETQRRYREANKEKLAETQRRYYQANKEKLADGSVPILRQMERRDCQDFQRCFDQAALKNLRQVPCHLCQHFIKEKHER
jgi:NAD dependent epimerase/dehydratase family enzyme